MALCTTTAPFDGISGKFGGDNGVVAMPTSGRNVLREMVIPTNPDTTRQQTIRGYLAQISAAIGLVTTAEKAGWQTLADNITRRGRLDLDYQLSWNQAYSMVNSYRLQNGQAITDTAPSWEALPPPSTIGAGDVGVVGSDLEIALTHTLGIAGGFFAMRVTSALPSQVRNARENELRVITTSFADSIVASAASPQTVALTMGTFTVAVDDFIGIEVTVLSNDYVPSGRLFVPNVEIQ